MSEQFHIADHLIDGKEYIVSVDLAKKRDATAIQIYRDKPEVIPTIPGSPRRLKVVNYLELAYQRKIQQMNYLDQVRFIVDITNSVDISNNFTLLVDGTGVGDPVVDIMRENGLNPIPIIFTSGGSINEIAQPFGQVFGSSSSTRLNGMKVLKEIRVPKDTLVHAGMLVMQQKRLRTAYNLDHKEEFAMQLQRFVGKVNEKTKRVSYGNESDDIHDDFVVAFLMAAWYSAYKREDVREAVVHLGRSDADYDPMDYVGRRDSSYDDDWRM